MNHESIVSIENIQELHHLPSVLGPVEKSPHRRVRQQPVLAIRADVSVEVPLSDFRSTRKRAVHESQATVPGGMAAQRSLREDLAATVRTNHQPKFALESLVVLSLRIRLRKNSKYETNQPLRMTGFYSIRVRGNSRLERSSSVSCGARIPSLSGIDRIGRI